MSKKERLAEFNKSNTINAAKILFDKKGVVQTTMDEIAKEAGCSKSTIYTYFASKDEIFSHIVLEYFTMLKNGIKLAIETTPNFPESFFAMGETVVKFYAENPFYLESILAEIKIAQGDDDAILFKIYEVGEELNGIMEAYFKDCIEKGYVRNDFASLFQATFNIWACVCGIVSMAHKKEKYIFHKEGITKEEFIQNGLTMLLASITKK